MPRKQKDEQQVLVDLMPPNLKAIRAAARKYRAIVTERQALTAQEVAAKATIVGEMKASGIQPDADGVITCVLAEMTITMKPRDELVRVKLVEEEDGESGKE